MLDHNPDAAGGLRFEQVKQAERDARAQADTIYNLKTLAGAGGCWAPDALGYVYGVSPPKPTNRW